MLSWLKNYCYNFVTQLFSYHSKAFRTYSGGGGYPPPPPPAALVFCKVSTKCCQDVKTRKK